MLVEFLRFEPVHKVGVIVGRGEVVDGEFKSGFEIGAGETTALWLINFQNGGFGVLNAAERSSFKDAASRGRQNFLRDLHSFIDLLHSSWR